MKRDPERLARVLRDIHGARAATVARHYAQGAISEDSRSEWSEAAAFLESENKRQETAP